MVYTELITLTIKNNIITKVLTVNKKYIIKKSAKTLLLEKKKSYKIIKEQLFLDKYLYISKKNNLRA
jgi:hypothetical protein